jgi:hypothetical protein
MKPINDAAGSLARATSGADASTVATKVASCLHFSAEERQAAIDHVLSAVIAGRSVRSVLLDDGGNEISPRLPSVCIWWDWLNKDPALAEHLARAREFGIEALMDECIDIADNAAEDPASRRVRIETRMKLAQMLKPRKYSPKLDVTSNQETVGLAEAMAAARLRVIEARARQEAYECDG